MRALVSVLFLGLAMAGCLDASQPASDGDPSGDDPTNPGAVSSPLTFLPSVDLICPERETYAQGCAQFGEPTLDVAGDGTIWYSAVCCVGQSPPIWISKDGGQSFQILPFADRTGLVRDATGVEGDFAIDDAGNVYFFDILAATAYFTKYQADAMHVHTKPDPFPPLVDRPWVRAGAEDEVFILYNTGFSSRFYRSDTGGLAWDHVGATEFSCGLGGLGQGDDRDELLVVACDTLWRSSDGGVTWDAGVALDMPADQTTNGGPTPPGYSDGLDIAYAPYAYALEDGTVLGVTAVHPDGTQVVHEAITATTGIVDYPWLMAGRGGHVAVAFYAAEDVTAENETEAEWVLKVATTTNGHLADADWTVTQADPEILFTGNLGRQPGDFLQIRSAENGDLVIAYAAREPYDGTLVNRFVRSDGMDFGPPVFRNGPQPA